MARANFTDIRRCIVIATIDYQSLDGPQRLVESFRNIGFAIIDKPPLDVKLQQHCYKMWQDFFANPDERYAFDEATNAGWVGIDCSETAKGNNVADIKEFFHYFPEKSCPEVLREVTQAMYQQLYPLAVTLLSWVEAASPEHVRKRFSMPLVDMVATNVSLFRILHYPPLNMDFPEGAMRAAAHEDINLITILPADTSGGLEVKTLSGEWLSLEMKPNQVVVNIADMLQECSGHYFPSTPHRVVNPKGPDAYKSRLSMPLFLHPRDEVVLSKRYTAASYREERFREIGLLAKEEETV